MNDPPPPLLTKLLFLPLKERVQRSAPSRMGWGTQWLACLSGYKLQRHTAIHSQRWEQRSPTIGPHCHSAIITTARGWTAHFFYYNWAFFSPPLSTMVLKNMISSFESFEWLQTFFFFSERTKCRDPLWIVSFWDWSVDGTVGSCYGSVCQHCKGRGGEKKKKTHLKLINSGSEKKKKKKKFFHLSSSVICQI